MPDDPLPNSISGAPVSILFRNPPRGASRNIRRRSLGQFLRTAAAQVVPGQPVTCLITDDRELQALNRTFRHTDKPTDVLSFAHAGAPGGELAISLDRAAEQADSLGHRVEQELRILILHGLLHLAGMDHETDGGEMARAEARWRKRMKLPPGLVERNLTAGRNARQRA